jgi:hypothetical protein
MKILLTGSIAFRANDSETEMGTITEYVAGKGNGKGLP